MFFVPLLAIFSCFCATDSFGFCNTYKKSYNDNVSNDNEIPEETKKTMIQKQFSHAKNIPTHTTLDAAVNIVSTLYSIHTVR